MMANRKLARAVADAAMGQLVQFLKTKVGNFGGDLFIASRWFPSTKRCSCCGQVKKRMPLKQRTYQCQQCGLVIDRDLNAALNVWWFATQQLRQLHAQSWPSWAVARTDDVKAAARADVRPKRGG